MYIIVKNLLIFIVKNLMDKSIMTQFIFLYLQIFEKNMPHPTLMGDMATS